MTNEWVKKTVESAGTLCVVFGHCSRLAGTLFTWESLVRSPLLSFGSYSIDFFKASSFRRGVVAGLKISVFWLCSWSRVQISLRGTFYQLLDIVKF